MVALPVIGPNMPAAASTISARPECGKLPSLSRMPSLVARPLKVPSESIISVTRNVTKKRMIAPVARLPLKRQ